MSHCKFRTSWGGALFCQKRPYLEGFCQFHYSAFASGEINERGVLNELLSNQDRRREINYYGLDIPGGTYLEDLE